MTADAFDCRLEKPRCSLSLPAAADLTFQPKGLEEMTGEEGDAGVSMQNGEENTAKGSAPAAQNYRVVKILCAVLGVLVILVLAGIGFMVIGSKKRKKILLKY